MSTVSRDEQLVKALEAIATLPEGEIKKKLSKEISDRLTIRESIEIASELSAIQSGASITESYEKYLAVMFSVYELLGVPLDVPVGEVLPEVGEKIDRVRPQLDELNALLKRIVSAYNEGDRT